MSPPHTETEPDLNANHIPKYTQNLRVGEKPIRTTTYGLFGIEFCAPWHVTRARALQTLAAIHYSCMWLVAPVFCVYIPVYLLLYSNLRWLVLLYLCWLYYDRRRPQIGGRVTESVKNWAFWRHLRDYFPIRLVKTAELDPNRNYIFGYHPHGISAVGAFTNFATNATNFPQVFPGIKSHLLTLVGMFYFPLRRDYCMLADVHECSEAAITHLFSAKDKGHALLIVIGGAAEVMFAQPGQHRLVLLKRKGFVKMAIKHGADLVPVYSFGENDLYHQLQPADGSRAQRFQFWTKKIIGIPFVLFHGRGIFNYTFGLVPFRRPIHTVVGKPIRVDQCDHPSSDQIRSVHRQYIDGLIELFENEKHKYGVPEHVHLQFAA